uniref:Uncharacterized protein n=1 Tax=Neogobius melanostomus TaxID=47308 RepID=A0A8C6WQR9_9GOBI
MSSKPFSVLITGTSRGLGLEMVKQFAETQRPLSMLFSCCLDPANSEELQDLAKKHPDIIKVLRMDVADPDSIKQAAVQVGSLLGQSGLNLIINNATIAVYTPFLKSSPEDSTVTKPINIIHNFPSPGVLSSSTGHSGMSGMSCRKAAVINISSNLSSNDWIGLDCQFFNEIVLYDKLPMVPYRASKAALNMITSCASLELQKEELLCSLLHPGWVRTNMGGEYCIQGMIHLMNSMTDEHHGALVNYKGQTIPW